THTFIFPSFEASILIEETELFLGMKRSKAKSAKVAHCIQLLDTENFILKLTGSWIETKNILSSEGIKLSSLAGWIMSVIDRRTDDDKSAQGVSLYLAGLIV